MCYTPPIQLRKVSRFHTPHWHRPLIGETPPPPTKRQPSSRGTRGNSEPPTPPKIRQLIYIYYLRLQLEAEQDYVVHFIFYQKRALVLSMLIVKFCIKIT